MSIVSHGREINCKKYKNIDMYQYSGRGINWNIRVNNYYSPINKYVTIPFRSTMSKLKIFQFLVCSIDNVSFTTSYHKHLNTDYS